MKAGNENSLYYVLQLLFMQNRLTFRIIYDLIRPIWAEIPLDEKVPYPNMWQFFRRISGEFNSMVKSTNDPFSASEQGLGYSYQARFALLRLFQLPEDTAILMEKDDDLDFVDNKGVKTLASLKHKAEGDRLTDLSTDFWKSVRIWLARYNRDGRSECTLRFFIFTTSVVAENSFLTHFLPTEKDNPSILPLVQEALLATKSKVITPIKTELDKLSEDEKIDFFSRVVIFDNSPRINDVPKLIIEQHMRTVRREFRSPVYEHLEGWWNNLIIELLSGKRTLEIFGNEVSDKLSSIADEYKTDNLPINFRGKKTEGEIDPENDPRLFVTQLREIGIKPNRIQNAIYDYYRAFEQRSSWARENVLLEGEVEEYEDRLVDEWERYRDVISEDIKDDSSENVLQTAGKELYKWAELNTDHLRIRERVSEPYVVRGCFHILANWRPMPRVYWHPRFLERLDVLLSGTSK